MIIVVREYDVHENGMVNSTMHKGMKGLSDNVCDAYNNLAQDIENFEKALYTQRHAFYFRRVRERYDYSKVFCKTHHVVSLTVLKFVASR